MNKTKNSLVTLAECSVMVALATVLSMLKLFELPYGGSITPASMLPVALVAYRHGAKYGFGTAIVASVIQMLLGLKNFSYFSTVESFIALGLFDYILAFGVFGLAGLLRRRIKEQNLAFTLGVLITSVLRYVCHVISGATVWAGLSIPTEAALIYSLGYNATYMGPECIIMTLTAAYVSSSLDLATRIPTRKKTEKLDTVSAYLYLGAGLAMLVGLVIDTVLVFSKLQDAETGDFVFTNITTVDLPALLITTLVALAVSAALVFFARYRSKKA